MDFAFAIVSFLNATDTDGGLEVTVDPVIERGGRCSITSSASAIPAIWMG